MNIIDFLKEQTIKQLNGAIQDNDTFYKTDFLQTSDLYGANEAQIKEYRIWYEGNSDKLLQFFTKEMYINYPADPIYTRNKQNYFWSKSSDEDDIKRIHLNIPHAIVDTLINIISEPIIESTVEEKVNKIIEDNDLYSLISQEQEPLTLVEGWGAFKIDFDLNLRDTPIILYYPALNVDFVSTKNTLIGIIYKDFYKDEKGQDYVLFDIRRKEAGNSVIEKQLYKGTKNDRNPSESGLQRVPLNTLPFLTDTNEKVIIEGFNEILGVPSVFFRETIGTGYGRSIYAGITDNFDALDECASQASTTVRRSTPIEWISDDLLERSPYSGDPILPKVYDRKFLKKPEQKDGDGNSVGDPITTTQPVLNFIQYDQEIRNILDTTLIGILSPASLGLPVARKSPSDTQKDKEDTTIMTRNNIIRNQNKIIKKVINLALCIQEYIDTGSITMTNYDIGVRHKEFANLGFENEIQVLGIQLQSGNITPEKFVRCVWGDSISENDKMAEIEYIKKRLMQSSLGAIGNLGDQGHGIGQLSNENGELTIAEGENANNDENNNV